VIGVLGDERQVVLAAKCGRLAPGKTTTSQARNTASIAERPRPSSRKCERVRSAPGVWSSSDADGRLLTKRSLPFSRARGRLRGLARPRSDRRLLVRPEAVPVQLRAASATCTRRRRARSAGRPEACMSRRASDVHSSYPSRSRRPPQRLGPRCGVAGVSLQCDRLARMACRHCGGRVSAAEAASAPDLPPKERLVSRSGVRIRRGSSGGGDSSHGASSRTEGHSW
jgi:hypothetical protein